MVLWPLCCPGAGGPRPEETEACRGGNPQRGPSLAWHELKAGVCGWLSYLLWKFLPHTERAEHTDYT